MAWQRKTPFGYAIRDGRLTASPAEAEAVRSIYAQYLAGLSYGRIAEEMERRGIRYHAHTTEWNKHMVKRILENQKYLGADGYPCLVDDEDFLAVQHLRQDKNTYAPCPDFIEPVREKARCGACGARMTRDTKSHSRPRWHCRNDACELSRYISDEELWDAVDTRLRALAREPGLLRRSFRTAGKETSMEVVRLQNEITHELNHPDASPEYLKILILAHFTEGYQELPDPTPRHRLEQLLERLEGRQPSQTDIRDLLDQAVSSIRIGKAGTIALELADGQIFEGEEARQ